MVADKAVPKAKRILAEFRLVTLHLALEEILANHAGSTDFLAAPCAKYIHRTTFYS
jgi:hypothetical protein